MCVEVAFLARVGVYSRNSGRDNSFEVVVAPDIAGDCARLYALSVQDGHDILDECGFPRTDSAEQVECTHPVIL